MKRYLLAIMLVFLVSAGVAQAAKPLPYGTRPAVGRVYIVNATTFGGTSWDDNGIGYFGGIDLFKLKWGVAELGYFSHPAMGKLPGGTKILVSYPRSKRSVIVVVADIGSGGCCHWQIDLHIGVARALRVPNPAGWVGKVRITVLPGRPVRLTPATVNRGIKHIGPIPYEDPEKIKLTLYSDPLPRVRRSCEGAYSPHINRAGFGCTSIRPTNS